MSRHYHHCEHEGQQVCVLLGYDRPLREFFLQIISTADNTMLYASQADPNCEPESLEYCRKVLRDRGITVPESLFHEIEKESQGFAIHPVVEHFENGRQRVIVARLPSRDREK